jgi:hypothetical protein
MSVDKRKHKIWDVDFEEPVPDARLTAFDEHKESLLANLRNVHGRGLKPEPFDADKSWCDLTRYARYYFWEAGQKQRKTPAADRVQRLRELEKVLGRAREMVEQAMRDDIGWDLVRARFAETKIPLALVARTPSIAPGITKEIEKMAAGLTVLERTAGKAARDVRTGRGRPKGASVLPYKYIIGLADLYRRSTGAKPRTSRQGQFVHFVGAFLTAIGRRNIADTTIIDVVKDARLKSLHSPAPGEPSPFR